MRFRGPVFPALFLTVGFLAGCGNPTSGPQDVASDTTAPALLTFLPPDSAIGVAADAELSGTFSEKLDPATLTASSFSVVAGTTPVAGTVTLTGNTATFHPSSFFANSTVYSVHISTAVKDAAGNSFAASRSWSFTTAGTGTGPAPVFLGTAGSFVLLAKTAVSTVPPSVITGDVGVSPAAETYLTGFSQTDALGWATSPQVTGLLFAADMTPPTPAKLTTAVSDMETAYTDAAGRPAPDFVNLGAGEIGGLTLSPGLYKWTTGVTASTDVTLAGGVNDVWILQMSGNLTLANGKQLILTGGARAKNIYWQVAGGADLGTTSHFEGILLCQTAIVLKTGATMNGRALAQSAVTLDQSTVTRPAP